MKITQTKTPEDFKNIKKKELYQLWYIESYTDKQVAKMYGVTAEEVKNKRADFDLTMWKASWLFMLGGEQWKDARKAEMRKKKAEEKRKKEAEKYTKKYLKSKDTKK